MAEHGCRCRHRAGKAGDEHAGAGAVGRVDPVDLQGDPGAVEPRRHGPLRGPDDHSARG